MNRSPGLAGVLSVVLPGLGHLYAGATARGVALAAAFVAVHELVAVAIAIWVFGIVNAIRTTEELVRAHAERRPAAVSLDRNWAAGLMGAGVVATLAMIPELEWALRLWPLVLVWIGFQLFRGRPLVPGAPDPPAEGAGTTRTAPEPPGAAPVADVSPSPPASIDSPAPVPPEEEEEKEEN